MSTEPGTIHYPLSEFVNRDNFGQSLRVNSIVIRSRHLSSPPPDHRTGTGATNVHDDQDSLGNEHVVRHR